MVSALLHKRRGSRLINISIGEIYMRPLYERDDLHTSNVVWKAPGRFETQIPILDDLFLPTRTIEPLDDLAVRDSARVTGGSLAAGQTVRLRIASTNNQGRL
jgi:hypothetical protein